MIAHHWIVVVVVVVVVVVLVCYHVNVTGDVQQLAGPVSYALHQQYGAESGVHVPRRENHQLHLRGVYPSSALPRYRLRFRVL